MSINRIRNYDKSKGQQGRCEEMLYGSLSLTLTKGLLEVTINCPFHFILLLLLTLYDLHLPTNNRNLFKKKKKRDNKKVIVSDAKCP